MANHRFRVGLLTELAPHEHPHLLGLNEVCHRQQLWFIAPDFKMRFCQNSGEAIKLRVRTDQYDGFRAYSEIRRVALHELTHNEWGAHDDNFKALNSQLNREVAEFEAAARAGTHTLGGYNAGPEIGEDAPASGSGGGAYVLGGGSGDGALSLTPEERRAKAVEAAMKRLEESEAEMEERCAN